MRPAGSEGKNAADVHVICPPPAPLTFSDEALLARLGRLGTPTPVPTLERLLAADLMNRRPAGNTTPLERFLARPAAETILARFWPEMTGKLDRRLAERIVGALVGAPVLPRDEIARSVQNLSGRRTVYAPRGHANAWIDRINAAESDGWSPFTLACHAYAETALSHPFADGNGRLARALFHRALARRGVVRAPLLPMGPLIYRHHRVVIAALVTLGTVGDWRPFYAVMSAICEDAVDFTERNLGNPSEAPNAAVGP